MDLKKFSKEVASILPTIHVELVKRQPEFMLRKITLPQMVIINILSARPGCKMGDLSKILGVTKGAVTGLTDRLMRSGLLRRARSKEDRRIVNVELTSKGKSYARRLNEFKLKVVSSLFSNISADERAQYLAILRKLQRNVQAKREYKYYG